MPKSLGQIHTLNYNFETLATGTGTSNAGLCDISQELSSQLQRNIHQAQYFKCVGIDLTLDSAEGGIFGGDKATVKGRLRYYAPTQGRCEAYRSAFKAMMSQMKLQGVNHQLNKLYDFRVTLRDQAFYAMNVLNPSTELFNLATLDGINMLSLTDGTIPGSEIFDQHNRDVEPVEVGVPNFSPGLTTQIGTVVAQTDFVMKEGLIQGGNPNHASLEMEEIPFVLAWDPANEQAVSLQWRPDPALYIPIMCGQVELVLDEIEASGAPAPILDSVEVNVAIHIAGWKSILSAPKRNSKKFLPRSKK